MRGQTIAVIVALLGSPAWAAPAPAPDRETIIKVEVLAERAAQAVDAGDFEAAVQHYIAAHELDGRAALLLYNIAYIYDHHLAQPATAVTFYRRFRTHPTAELKLVIKASERIETLQIEQARTEAARAAEAAEAAEAERQARAAEAEDEEAAAPTVYVFRPLDDRGSKWSRGLGWTLLGVGVAGLAGGGLLAWQADAAQADFDAARTVGAKAAARDDGRAYAVGADLAVAAGVATIVGGAVLLWLADEPGTLRPEPVVPTVSPTESGAVLGLQGAF